MTRAKRFAQSPGARSTFDNKVWIVEATAANADRILKTIRPNASEELVQWVANELSVAEDSLVMPLADDAELLIPWATKRMPWQPEEVNEEKFNGLLPHQRSGVDAIVNGDSRALLGDDMGLGKTLQIISAVEEWRLRVEAKTGILPVGPKLVICPSTLKGSWKRELIRWLDSPEVVVVDGRTPKKRAEQITEGVERDAWVIINWEQLRLQKSKVKKQMRNGGTKTIVVKTLKDPQLEETDWLAIAADEIHRAKNKDSQQTQGLWRLQTHLMIEKNPLGPGIQVGASGTPFLNSPDEMWAPMAWLWPDSFHERGAAHREGAIPYWNFYNDFVDYYEDHRGRKVVTGVKNPDALKFLLKGKVIRRTAKLLGLQGRKRFFYDVSLNPGQQKLYDEAERAMWLAIEEGISAGNKDAIDFAKAAIESGNVVNLIRIPNGASRLVRLQQIIENPALIGGADDSAIMDDFMQKIEDSAPEPWVLFFKYKESCNLMAERLRKHNYRVGVYNGDVAPAVRTNLEDMFQAGDLDVLCGTLDAMKEGVTLTRSHLMGFGTRSFVPGHNEQAEMREDRLGQQDLVRVYIPQAEGTVATDKVHAINKLKESIIRTVLEKDKIEEAAN
jgi:SNF2 family DNA or RNA helicase